MPWNSQEWDKRSKFLNGAQLMQNVRTTQKKDPGVAYIPIATTTATEALLNSHSFGVLYLIYAKTRDAEKS